MLPNVTGRACKQFRLAELLRMRVRAHVVPTRPSHLGEYSDRTPNTNAAVGVPGDQLLPPHVGGNWRDSLSIDDPGGRILDERIPPVSVAVWVTGSPPTWEDETPQFQQERLRATECDGDRRK